LKRFFISLVLPSILGIALFILAIFALILPAFEQNAMKGKKEMISELTHSACSLIDEYRLEAERGIISPDTARMLAIERVKRLRYGDEGKDYFWIIDQEPRMIMHPYRTELIGSDLNSYRDSEGKLLFVEAARVVREQGSGYIDYQWQWKNDSTRIVPKLSYVTAYPEWGWIVGTGIYLEDVREEIKVLRRSLLRVALGIALVITVLLAFIIRASLGIERRRQAAEAALLLSREKYKSLVEASSEGTLMLAGERFVFSNQKFAMLSGYSSQELAALGFENLFEQAWGPLEASFQDPDKSVTREASLRCKDQSIREVVLSASRVSYGASFAYILVVKELSPVKQFQQEALHLQDDLQALLSWMHQPVAPMLREAVICSPELAPGDASQLMGRKNTPVLFVRYQEEIVGQISAAELGERALAEGSDPNTRLIQLMTAPVYYLDAGATMAEALHLMKQKKRTHVLVKQEDRQPQMLAYHDLALYQENKLDSLLLEIERAEGTWRLKQLHGRLPVLVSQLLESGIKTRVLTGLISKVADAMHRRVVGLALEELGRPPCGFAFMVMGSQGRGEQSLATDQDNAIIIDGSVTALNEGQRNWFIELGREINDRLAEVGYERCKGEVMAGNPQWNTGLTEWKEKVNSWVAESDPKAVLDTSIFFDFKFIDGDPELVTSLWEHVISSTDGRGVFFYHMAHAVQKMKIPSPNASFDVKQWLLPIQAFARIHSLQEGLSHTSTHGRAEALFRSGKIEQSMYEVLTGHLDFLSHLRIRLQLSSILKKEQPGNVLIPEQLTGSEKHLLKLIHRQVQDLQSLLAANFNLHQA